MIQMLEKLQTFSKISIKNIIRLGGRKVVNLSYFDGEKKEVEC